MASLSETFHPSKNIVYLIQILQTDFESPHNVMASNPCIIPRCLSWRIVKIMHLKNIINRKYIVCHRKK